MTDWYSVDESSMDEHFRHGEERVYRQPLLRNDTDMTLLGSRHDSVVSHSTAGMDLDEELSEQPQVVANKDEGDEDDRARRMSGVEEDDDAYINGQRIDM